MGVDDELNVKPHGGGGTMFSPVTEYINNMESLPACVVFLTDLECDDFGVAPSCPVLWCVYDNKNPVAPYGEIVEVTNED